MTDALDPWSVKLGTTTLIEASAGTGKTHAISTLFVRLLLEAKLPVDRILVVTFTEKAAAELRDRVRTRLHIALAELTTAGGDELGPILRNRAEAGHDDATPLRAAIRSFDIAPISTIHGFCNGVLRRHAFETGVAMHTELIMDDRPMLDEIVRDHAARELYGADPEFVASLAPNSQKYDRWLRLARLVVGHPLLPVDPPAVEVGPLPDRGSYEAAYAECRRILLTDEAAIRALVTAPAMHAIYVDEGDRWLDSAAYQLRRPDATGIVPPGAFKPFSNFQIDKKTRVDFKRRFGPVLHPFFDATDVLLAEIRRLQDAYAERALAFKVGLVKFARKEAPKRKRTAGVQSYDDLLQHLDTAVRHRPRNRRNLIVEQLRSRFGAALIDEFQDTDPVQFRIFETVFDHPGSSLLLIGDPKQAIYGFRGADVFAYLDAARKVGKRRLTMRHNWRSDPGLLAGVAELFAVENPFVLSEIDFVPVEPRPGAGNRLSIDGVPASPFHLAVLPKEGAERQRGGVAPKWAQAVIPARIAADIAGLLAADARIADGTPGGRRVHAGDVAVLTRRNSQAMEVQAELRRIGIPSVVYGDSTVFQTREATELAHVLGAVAEPTRTQGVRAALATEMLGATATELSHLGDDDDAWERWVDLFRRLAVTWQARGFIQMFRAMLSDTKASARLLLLSDGERRMTNLLHLAELLHATASEEHLGPLALLQWFEEQRKVGDTAVETFKLRLERDDRAVQLITIHRSKGLEYPIVYCPYSWSVDSLFDSDQEDLLYHAEGTNEQRLDLRPKSQKGELIALAARETLAEARRLLYVALTRARHRCVLVWTPLEDNERSTLGSLLSASTTTGHAGYGKDLIEPKDDVILERLRARGGDKWTVDLLLPPDGTARHTAADAPPPDLAARRPRAAIDRLWRTSSFSNLASTQSVGGPLFVDFADARAHDEALASAATTVEPLWEAPPPAEVTAVTLAEFPRGIAAGNFFHDLIEHLDFTCDEATRRQAVIDALGAHGFPAATWASTVDTALCEILAAPLGPTRADGAAVRLCDIDRAHRLDELEFLLPAAGLEATIGRHALARVFQDHPEGLPEGYGDRVASLGFPPLRGFLKGFIDMVFTADDTWWVVDYKTNHVGSAPQDYGRARLDRAMAEDHYILQYHLYAVALVRMLALRVPGFDYDRHFGGALYLFVRGMSPAHPTMGVWHERPPRARIEALSTLLELGGHHRGATTGGA